jgi:hypothetical protein
MEETKRNYQQELFERCEQWVLHYEETIARDSLVEFDWAKNLHDFVKEVALDSFRNGVQAGIRRASGGGRPQGNAPRRPSRNYKGTALANGRLQRAERELVVEEA